MLPDVEAKARQIGAGNLSGGVTLAVRKYRTADEATVTRSPRAMANYCCCGIAGHEDGCPHRSDKIAMYLEEASREALAEALVDTERELVSLQAEVARLRRLYVESDDV